MAQGELQSAEADQAGMPPAAWQDAAARQEAVATPQPPRPSVWGTPLPPGVPLTRRDGMACGPEWNGVFAPSCHSNDTCIMMHVSQCACAVCNDSVVYIL